MDDFAISILTNLIYDVIKGATKVTTRLLKQKFDGQIAEGHQVEEIEKIIEKTVKHFHETQSQVTQDVILTYMKSQENIVKLLLNNKEKQEIKQTSYGDHAKIIANVEHYVENYTVHKHYDEDTRGEKTYGNMSYLFHKFSVKIVRSYSQIRECVKIDDGEDTSVYVPITIPKNVIDEQRNAFIMLLLSNYNEENWVNYYDEKYNLCFDLELSENIQQLQLQIKNRHQQQFVDIPLNQQVYKLSLCELAGRDAWKSVLEICFVFFIDDRYIKDSEGYIRIKGLKLTTLPKD